MNAGRLFALSLVAAVLCAAAFPIFAGKVFDLEAQPFDGRIGGYDFPAANAYLTLLKDSGATQAYLTTFRQIDTVFPLAIFGLTVSALWGLWSRRARAIAVLGVVAASVYLMADYIENAAVASLLRSGPDGIAESAVSFASTATQIKWIALLACGLLCLTGIAAWLFGKGR